MSQFLIDQSFWDLFPEAEIGVVLAKGINNTEEGTQSVRPDIMSWLEHGHHEALSTGI